MSSSRRHATTRRAARALLVVFLLLGFAAFGFSFLTGANRAPAPDGNPPVQIQNPGFEEWSGELPKGWLFEERIKSKGTLSREQTHRSSGQAALRLSPNDHNREELLPFAVGQGFSAELLRGKSLSIAGAVGAEGGAEAVVGLYAVRKDGTIAAAAALSRNSMEGGLTRRTGVLRVPDDRDVLLVIARCAAKGQSGAAYFDDVAVEVSAAAVAPPPANAANADQPLTAEIRIDAGRPLRSIPRTIYGMNIEWTHDGMGLWDARRNQLDPDLIRLTKELGVSLIRFPGGVYSDFYHWRDGVGPRENRPTTPHYRGGPASRHNFGTDEALAFAGEAGAELLITVNAGTGTPDEAAQWMQYVQGAAQPGGGAGRVRYWEIGNELYIQDDNPTSKSVAMPPEDYAAKFLDFARAMRAADPAAKLGAIGGENYGRYQQSSFANWNRHVLTTAGDQIDFLAIHNAYAPLVPDARGLEVRDVYTAMLAAPRLIQKNLETVTEQIRTHAPVRADKITIAVTEWGPFFHTQPDSPYVDHVKTLGSALFAASVLKVFIESPRVEIANAFKLNEQTFMGWIGQRDGKWVAKGPYFALQMFTRHFGDVLVFSQTHSPTFESRSVGFVEAAPDVPYLDAVCSVSGDRSALYLMAVNKHFDRPISAAIDIDGFTPWTQATAWTLTGTGIDAHTGAELPEIPGIHWAKQAEDRSNPRFSSGGPKEVTIGTSAVEGVGSSFTYAFPARSVTSLVIRAKE